MITLQRETTEYVYVGITGDVVSGDVEVAFLAAGVRPEEADWSTAEKVTSDAHNLWSDAEASGVDGTWYAARLIGDFGAGGVTLAAGDYQVWVRLTDDVERPVRIAPVTLEVA